MIGYEVKIVYFIYMVWYIWIYICGKNVIKFRKFFFLFLNICINQENNMCG